MTRRSVSAQLLSAAVEEITAAGHHHVLVLGDISDDGSPALIGAALTAITDGGLEAWAVPGNHDLTQDSHALAIAAEGINGSVGVLSAPTRVRESIALAGMALRSDDRGQTCEAVNLPDVSAVTSQLLLWAGHYPLVSQQAALLAVGLRYPGDLQNLAESRAAASRHHGPIVVLHGHLHTAISSKHGRMLQLGFPAVVEWPHAWTDLRIETSPLGATVRTATRSIAGSWSRCRQDTLLTSTVQNWQLAGGRWQAAAARTGASTRGGSKTT